MTGFALVLSIALLCLVLQLELLRKVHAYFILRKTACDYARSLILGKPHSMGVKISYRYKLGVDQVRAFVLWKYPTLFSKEFIGLPKRSFEVSESCLFPYGS